MSQISSVDGLVAEFMDEGALGFTMVLELRLGSLAVGNTWENDEFLGSFVQLVV